jgi:hypothetical protein
VLVDDEQRQAVVQASMVATLPTADRGLGATLVLDGPFYRPGPMGCGSATANFWEEDRVAHVGLYHEALEVARCMAPA